MWSYSDDAIDHQLAPRRYGVPVGATVVGVASDGTGETEYRVGLVLDEVGVIRIFGFEYRGSAQSVASASMLGEMVIGRRLPFAATIDEASVGRALGGLPEDVLHQECLSLAALRDAYRRWTAGRPEVGDLLVCTCHSVARGAIEAAIRGGAATVFEIGEATKAGTGCGTCRPELAKMLGEFRARNERESAVEAMAGQLSEADRARLELIEEVLEEEVRPGLALDGGGLDVVGLEGKHLTLRFRGACVSCNHSGSTMRFLVEDRLHSMVDPGLEIVTV